MTNEYTSRDTDFSARISNTYFKLTIMAPVCGLAIAALGYSIMYPDGKRRIARFSGILEGLSIMDVASIAITLVIAILILTGLIAFLKSYYKNREIVIALKFDDHRKELTVKTKRIDQHEFIRTHKYSDLSLERNHLSDGMTPPMYNTLTLVKGNYLVGHIYTDHFTWDEVTLSEIKIRLKNVL